MLVSGTMSESEITSSFPDMLAELSKGSSAFKLQGITVMKKKKDSGKPNKKGENSHSSTCEMNPGQVPCLLICAPPPLQTCGEGRSRVRWKMKPVTWAVTLYLSGGETEATPVLPNDELDRLAWLSSGLSTRGGVLGTRSGLAECTPEEKQSVKYN